MGSHSKLSGIVKSGCGQGWGNSSRITQTLEEGHGDVLRVNWSVSPCWLAGWVNKYRDMGKEECSGDCTGGEGNACA